MESKYLFFLGFFYFNNVIIEKNKNEAFKLFLKAVKNYPIVQVYLAKCYKKGIKTTINHNLAFN